MHLVVVMNAIIGKEKRMINARKHVNAVLEPDKAKSQERINYYNLPIVNATNDGSIQQNKFAVTHQSRVTKVNATASTTPIYHQVNKILMVELAVILMMVQITIKFTVVKTTRLTIKILLRNAFQVIRINQMKISKDI